MSATTSFPVAGLHCGSCVANVTEELEDLAGVESVDIVLVSDGVSTVTVVADRELTDTEVQAALSEAGDFALTR